MIIWAGVLAVALAFGISALATTLSQPVAYRFGMIDQPGRHKAHAAPVPLLGGCAIFAAFLGPTLLALALASAWAETGVPSWLPQAIAVHLPGAAMRAPAALGILAAAFVLHVLGLIDDKRDLPALLKLLVELVLALLVVLFCGVRVLTAAGTTVSVIVSVLWLVAITNAFNFLDNMDGLSAGVAAICAAALLGASASIGQVFVSAWLCLLLGALLGFLPYNFPPAATYMGDAGSLVVGFLLAVASCLTTYVQPGRPFYMYGVFVPFVLMAIPLYDMISVIVLRIVQRRSPLVGDRWHFSHRLVRRGMAVRTAVLTVYLCTAATAIAASLLPHVDDIGAVLVFCQTVAIVLILAQLEFGNARS